MAVHGGFHQGVFSVSYRVYYEDTDAGGVVYYANYLKFAERARTEALRACGFNQSDLLEQSFGFVVRRCSIDFKKPARLDDLLTIETKLHDIGKASVEMHQTIRQNAAELAVLHVRLAAVGKGLKPARLPEEIARAMRTKFKMKEL